MTIANGAISLAITAAFFLCLMGLLSLAFRLMLAGADMLLPLLH